ncbi:MsnO8 family LLM class oxidoreductase [Acinetobacter puyangensis]|uniref:MsnO8 family LLM class oxidoreductase n=1 Tax=Acinetobacter puyangensis TaxID=1096779 RepID=UPI003A4DE441
MGLNYQLSFLDRCPRSEGQTSESALNNALELVSRLEDIGFSRYWVAEHHSTLPLVSSSPEILIAWLIAQTKRIRIGSGGVMLQHYSPYKVAENFNLLSALSNGRVDLGIGKAPGGFPASTRALQHGIDAAQKGDFSEQLATLDHFLDSTFDPENKEEAFASPTPQQTAQRFLLGASVESAQIAASLDWNFVFATHYNGNPQVLHDALTLFKSQSKTGKALLSVQVVVAETSEQIEQQAEKLTIWSLELENGVRVKIPTEEAGLEFARQANSPIKQLKQEQRSVVQGTADEVYQQLQALHEQYQIDEFVLDFAASDHAERLKALDLLAQQSQLAA